MPLFVTLTLMYVGGFFGSTLERTMTLRLRLAVSFVRLARCAIDARNNDTTTAENVLIASSAAIVRSCALQNSSIASNMNSPHGHWIPLLLGLIPSSIHARVHRDFSFTLSARSVATDSDDGEFLSNQFALGPSPFLISLRADAWRTSDHAELCAILLQCASACAC
jgi:hypothetical protein